jgi:hypothetical protein
MQVLKKSDNDFFGDDDDEEKEDKAKSNTVDGDDIFDENF